MSHGGKCCEEFSRIIVTSPCRFPCDKGVRGDPHPALINTGPEFSYDPRLLQVPDSFKDFVTAEAQPFSDLSERGWDKREPPFQLLDQSNINLVHR
jgi:hypothetical protein